MKTIEQLCRELPGSETELRARAEEFCIEIGAKVLGLQLFQDANSGYYFRFNNRSSMPDFLNSIADAKAATDAMIAKGFWFRCQLNLPLSDCWLAVLQEQGGGRQYVAYASTEELSRSAAAYLAALAMEEERS